MNTLIVDIRNGTDIEQIKDAMSKLEGVDNVRVIYDDEEQENLSADAEMLFLNSIPEMRETIIEGLKTSLEDCIPVEELIPD